MWNMTGGSPSGDKFRMAPGARIAGRDGDSFKVRVTIPSDEDGFLGRQCPHCRQIFRVDGEDHEALPDEIELWCVYCGHHDDHSEFLTQQQHDRMMRAAGDIGVQIVGQALDKAFSGFTLVAAFRSPHGVWHRDPVPKEAVLPEIAAGHQRGETGPSPHLCGLFAAVRGVR
jgi:hypothetical protein